MIDLTYSHKVVEYGRFDMSDPQNLITRPREIDPKANYPVTGNSSGEVNPTPVATAGALTGFQEPDPLRKIRAELEVVASNQTLSATAKTLNPESNPDLEIKAATDSNQPTPTSIFTERQRKLEKAA